MPTRRVQHLSETTLYPSWLSSELFKVRACAMCGGALPELGRHPGGVDCMEFRGLGWPSTVRSVLT